MSQALTLIAGRYRCLRPLGEGPTATVVLAEDELLRRRVAVKLLHPHGDEAMARRLLREAKIGASLNHPNLVIVFDTLLHGSDLVVVTEYVKGETLAEALENEEIGHQRGLAILRAVAAGLDHAHEHGVVHRDVRPENILLGHDGMVKLADLGIAQSADSTQITQAGTASSPVSNVAPEQFMGEKSTPASDVYGLAAVALALFGGRRAHLEADPRTTVDLEAWERVPSEVAHVLERGLARDPSHRPAGAGVLVDALSDALGRAEAAALPVPPLDAEPPGPVKGSATASPAARRAAVRPTTRRGAPPDRRLAVLISVIAFALVAGGLATLLFSGGSGGDDPAGKQRADRTPADADGRGQAPVGGMSGESTSDDAPPNAEAGGSAVAPSTADDGEGATEVAGQSAGAPEAEAPIGAVPDAVASEAESAATPVGAVRAFYGRAARQDAVGVCALRGPRLQARFGCGELTAQFASLRSVAFDRITLEAKSAQAATVAVTTTATHVDYTDRCRGSVALVKGGAADWLLDRLAVACTRS